MILTPITKKFKNLSKKNKRLLLNTTLSFAVKGGALIISLFTLPGYMRFFEKSEILGLWFTALSILSWILTFDLGIGNGLRNHLVQAFSEKDMPKARKFISSAYIITGVTVVFISVIGFFLLSLLNWNKVFNISSIIVPKEVLLTVVRFIFIGVMLQFFFRLICSILFALQKPAIPSLLNLFSSVLLLSFVLFANVGSISENLVKLSYFNIIAANFPLLLATVAVFSTKLRNCFPGIRFYNRELALKIMVLGGAFFWLQIMFMLISNTNEFLISWLINTSKVVDFKIYNSLFSLIGTIFVLALTPIWSEITEAYATKEYRWIKELYKKLYHFAIIATIGEIMLAFGLQVIIDFWLKEKAIKVDFRYACIFALSGIIFIWTGVLSSIIQGVGKLKVAIIFLTIGAIINIPLSYVFVLLTGSWISIVLANIISLLPFCIAQSLSLKKLFQQTLFNT